ncbi:MAG: oxidoreductase [Ectothiorhodospiraceae bacterium]|nr:oxidoreductase [Ectothiorhodospiraceae bacterium]
MLKIGLIGAGHLGSIHAKLLPNLTNAEFIGLYDIDTDRAAEIAGLHSVQAFPSIEALLAEVDLVDIVTPTPSHHDVAMQALQAGKDVFIEKPVTETVAQAQEIAKFARDNNRKVQVGHIERFNKAIVALNDYNLAPRFVESHRLAQFNPRGTDVPVVLDLMIHDIDIILSLVQSPVAKIMANGVAVVSEHVDIANARLEFENGCVANITSSRISQNKMRKMRMFQKDAYIAVDFLNGSADVFRLIDENDDDASPTFMLGQIEQGAVKRNIVFEQPQIPEGHNPLQYELQLFVDAVKEDTQPIVDVEVAGHALDVAQQIMDEISRNPV